MTMSSVSEFRRVFAVGPGEEGRKLSVREFFRFGLAVQRMEVVPLGMGVMAASVVVSTHSWGEVFSLRMLVTFVMLTAYVLVTNVVNCLADRWLDMEFKSRLSRAVHELGVRRVRRLILERLAAIAVFLIWLVTLTGHVELLLLVGIGVVLAFQYSLPPLHLKGAGIWQVPTVLVMVTFLPGIVLLRTYDRPIEWAAVLAILGLALTVNSAFIVNAAEDVPEDTEHSINTAPCALGLAASFVLGLTQLVVGAAIFVAATFPLAGFSWTYIPYLAMIGVGVRYFLHLLTGVRGKELAAAMEVVRGAKSWAFVAMLLAWGSVVPAAAVFAAR
ncbi:UbiA family prenyltransferase [Nocardia wallacei]|uniref:UbiA family prenyltransferase n=1 Tax=Nocardia wallacei TaxID=480035 RepID=UPI0024538E75|nr:UbiA family prenyltransferase [Nocardia wallacei]